MADRLAAALLALCATLGIFFLARDLYRRTRLVWLNPVLVSIATLIAGLSALEVEYGTYHLGGRLLGWFLGPTVVALGVPLATQWDEIVRQGRAIVASVLAGSIVGVVSGVAVAALLGAPAEVVRSIAPRSVTTPIAIGIATEAGGIPSLTAALVIASGVLVAVVGPGLLRRFGVRSPSAVGLALGAAGHGIGTARALEEGPLTGAAAGLAIGLMGVATALLVPLLLALLL